MDEDDNSLNQDRKDIACDYLCGWFILDSVAILPFNAILGLFKSESGDVNNDLIRVAKFGKLYKLVKLTKLLRVLKLAKKNSKIVGYIKQYLKIGLGFERLFIFLCTTLMFCHIITCLWVFVATSAQNTAEEGEE